MALVHPLKMQRFYCDVCKKIFKSENTYEVHIASQQHIKKLKNASSKEKAIEPIVESSQSFDGSDSDFDGEEPSSSPFGKALPVGACFFCEASFENSADAVESVLSHMENKHSFVLPYLNKLVDAEGLLADLGRLVGEEFACLGCGRQFFGRRQNRHTKSAAELRQEALNALRKHMNDKEHNFLYAGVEDPVMVYMANAERGNDETSLPPIARVGGELYNQFYNGDLANKTLVLPSPESKYEPEETYEIHLPSGGTIGHRRYFQTVFRQNPDAHLEVPKPRDGQLLYSGSRALMALDEKLIARILARDGRERLGDMQNRSRRDLKLGIRGNTVYARHFRAAQ
ncbi:hypothetical protein Aperf_G00000080847 [Anoplocephala perfoliata]